MFAIVFVVCARARAAHWRGRFNFYTLTIHLGLSS